MPNPNVMDLYTAYTNKDDDTVAECLTYLANFVYKRHFSYNQTNKEDLISEGVLMGCNLLSLFDPKKGNVGTFIYTGMRNSMTNYLQKIKRSILTQDGLEHTPAHYEEPDYSLEITEDQIKNYVGNYLIKRYYKYLPHLYFYLGKMGFSVKSSSKIQSIKLSYNEEVVRRLLCLTIYRIWITQECFPAWN